MGRRNTLAVPPVVLFAPGDYSTLEPCFLCTAALRHSHVGAVRFAGPASEPSQPTTTASATVTPSSTRSATVPGQLKFTAKAVTGKDISGADLAGRPVVLWFRAPWCQREAPGMAAAAKELGGKVTFLGVAALDQVPAMQQFVQRYDLTSFQHVADTDTAVWKRFGVTAQPAYIDGQGKVEVITSQLSEQDLRPRLNQLSCLGSTKWDVRVDSLFNMGERRGPAQRHATVGIQGST